MLLLAVLLLSVLGMLNLDTVVDKKEPTLEPHEVKVVLTSGAGGGGVLDEDRLNGFKPL